MKLVYTISNSQRKALFVQGQPVTIALPAPPIDIDDAADWARTVLPAELRECIVSAEESEVSVEPSWRSRAAVNLTDFIGDIDPPQGRFVVQVAAVIVTLRHGARRHAGNGVQWPANCEMDGRKLIEPVTTSRAEAE